MKKFLYLLLASVFAFSFTSCSDNDDDAQTGGNGNGAASVVDAIVGEYRSLMVTTLKEMPGDPTRSEGTVKISNAGNGKINVEIPQLAFGSMVIPSVTVTELEVSEEKGAYTFSKEENSSVNVEGEQKNYAIKFSGKINADGSYEFNEEMKYGKMPFTVVVKYTKYSELAMVEGTYSSLMVTTLKEMPADPMKSKGDVKIAIMEGNRLNITLPEYTFNNMVLPSIQLTEVEAEVADGTYAFSKDVKGSVEVNGEQKDYTVKFSGKVNADGSYEFNEEMKYGKMPFTLQIRYTQYSEAAFVAGTYATEIEATFKENPAMGVILSGKYNLKFDIQAPNKVTVSFPEMQSGKMVVPPLTLKDVTVKEENGVYSLTGSYEGEEEGSGKKVSMKFEGSVNADGSYKFNEELKYGTMPFTFVIDYKPQTK